MPYRPKPRRIPVRAAFAPPRPPGGVPGSRFVPGLHNRRDGGGALLALDPNSGLATLGGRADGRPRAGAGLRSWTDGTSTIRVDEPAATFDGSTQHLDRDTAGLMAELGTQYTFAAWIRPDSVATSNVQRVAVAYRSTSAILPIGGQVDHRDATGRFVVRGDANTLAIATVAGVQANVWQLLVGVRDGNTARVYLDGVEGTPATASFGTITPTTLHVGALVEGTTTRVQFFDGGIGPVMIWSRAFSEAEIVALYNGGTALQHTDLTTAQRSGLLAWIIPGTTSGRNDATGRYDLTATGSPPAEAGPGLTLMPGIPTYSDSFRSVTLTAATRGARAEGVSPLAGKSSWCWEGWTRGRIGHLGADTVIWSAIGADGSGVRLLAKANGRASLERLAAGGSVADDATSTDTIGGRVLAASTALSDADSATRQKLVVTPAEGWADHDLKAGDIVEVSGAAGIGTEDVSVAEVSLAGVITLIYEGTGKTAPTAGEIAAGVYVEHARQIEVSGGSSALEGRGERVAQRLGVHATPTAVTFIFRGRTETVTWEGGTIPDDAVETLGAPTGSSLDSAPLAFHGLRTYGAPLAASQEADIAVRHGFWLSRTGWAGPGSSFFDAEEYGPIDRKLLAHYRVASYLCRPDGTDITDLDWYDGVHSTTGHPYWGHNTLRYPVGHRWGVNLGRHDQAATEECEVWVSILAPEHAESDLTPETAPEQVYFGRVATITVDPIPDTWTTADFTAASPPSLAQMQALRPCTLWRLGSGTFGTAVTGQSALQIDDIDGPIVVAGSSDLTTTVRQPVIVDSNDIHLRDMHVSHGGTSGPFVDQGNSSQVSYDRVLIGDPDNRPDERAGLASGSGTSRFLCFTRGWVRNGAAYGIFLSNAHQFSHFSCFVMDPPTSGAPTLYSTMRTTKQQGLSFSGRTRVAPISGSLGGPSLRHTNDGCVYSFDWGPGERLDGDSLEVQPSKANLFDHVYAAQLVVARGAYSTVRRVVADVDNTAPGIQVKVQTYARFLPIDNRALGNRTNTNSLNFGFFRYAPETGDYANPESDTLAFGTITAPATVAARTGSMVRYSTLGYPGGGSGLLKERIEVQDASTGSVSTVGQMGSSYGVFRSTAPVRVRAVAVEMDTDGVETGNEVAGEWSDAV